MEPEPEPLVVETFTPPPMPELEPELEPLVVDSFTPPPEPEPLVVESFAPPEPEPEPPPPPAPATATRAGVNAPVTRAPSRSAPIFVEPHAAPARRRPPMALIGAGAVVIAAIGVGAVMMMRGRGAPETPPPAAPPVAQAPAPVPPPVDSAALRAADSARAAQAAEDSLGVVRVTGDLPEDAEISLDTILVQGTSARVAAGRYTLSVISSQFQPWERRVTVRPGDTTRVYVELELLPDTTSAPQ